MVAVILLKQNKIKKEILLRLSLTRKARWVKMQVCVACERSSEQSVAEA